MKRQPLSVVSNSHKLTENRTMSGRTRKPPKRFIEDDVGNTKENSVSKQVDTCILMIWVITIIQMLLNTKIIFT